MAYLRSLQRTGREDNFTISSGSEELFCDWVPVFDSGSDQRRVGDGARGMYGSRIE